MAVTRKPFGLGAARSFLLSFLRFSLSSLVSDLHRRLMGHHGNKKVQLSQTLINARKRNQMSESIEKDCVRRPKMLMARLSNLHCLFRPIGNEASQRYSLTDKASL